MRVKCVICDTIHNLDDNLPLAKNCVIDQFILICAIFVMIAFRKILSHEWKQAISVLSYVTPDG